VARRLNRFVSPRIGDKPMASITLADVTRLLVTVSEQRPVAARKILEHLERIFGFAEVHGRGPQSVLTDSACDSIRKDSLRKPDKTRHHAYMSHEDVPGFWKKLNTLPDTPAKLGLQFLILNASRTNEVRGAKISELSADGATWTVSADRMKQRIAHAVPMSQQSQEIVKRARKLSKGSSFLFSSAGINATAMLLLLKGIEPGVTCHGFRSAFSDWANLRRENRDVIERILSHGSADKIRSSYFRNPMHGDRRALLGRWADHVTGARRRDKAGSR
jgi:integrase